ncbi:MAG TPA: hypothetical protein VF880_15005 [Actinomycetes bacterium]|jgi:hypothetical protein
MAEHNVPYLDRHPGDLWTAKDFIDTQLKIKADIRAKVQQAKDDINKTGVDKAKDAERFAGHSETEFLTELDGRYAAKLHEHEGQSVYRRYVKQLSGDPGYDVALLRHNLGRYPLVDVYELLPVTTRPNFTDCKLLFYYGHADRDQFGLFERVFKQRIPLGIPFQQLLTELAVDYDGDDPLSDVLNDFWDKFQEDPNDELKHCETEWITRACNEQRTVDDLKQQDIWDDLYVAIKPRKAAKGADAAQPQVDVVHLNYQSILVKGFGLDAGQTLDLIFLLRI